MGWDSLLSSCDSYSYYLLRYVTPAFSSTCFTTTCVCDKLIIPYVHLGKNGRRRAGVKICSPTLGDIKLDCLDGAPKETG